MKSPAITTGAPSSITSTTGDITLTNPGNSFFGATTLSGQDVSVAAAGNLEALLAATGNASVTAAGNLIVGGTAVNLATNSGGTTSFGVTTLTGGLNTTSVGDITQTGAITTGAPSSITSTTGDITLTGHQVQQNGVALASTSVDTRGTIHLLNSATDTTGSASVKVQKRQMENVAKLITNAGTKKIGYLEPAAYERTVKVLLAGGSDPVIKKDPGKAAYSHAIYEAAQK